MAENTSSDPALFEQLPASKGISVLSPRHLASVAGVKTRNFKTALKSGHNFHEYIKTPGSDKTSGRFVWLNDDLKPTPPEKRNWDWYNYFFFYFALSMDNWTLGSTFIGYGLTWKQAIAVVVISQVISSCAMALNSRNGAAYHIGYPVVARSVFGTYGALYVSGARAILAIFWYGVKLYSGAGFMVVMLTAVFGHHYTDIPNMLPASASYTTQQFLAFFLYWCMHVPFAFLRPFQIRWLFTLKMFTVIPAMFGLFIFCMATTKGNLGTIVAPTTYASKGFGWFFLVSINAGLGNTANLITNQPDYSRWAKHKNDAIWPQMIASPIAVTLAASLGILATSAVNHAWGTTIWNPWTLLGEIIVRYDRPDVKFAVFLCALFWSVLILGTNVAANSIPFGADVTLLLPRYLNMTRGQVLVLILAWVTCPWQILSSAGTFVTFLAGYGLFMASVVGILTADYYVVSRGNIFVKDLYHGGPGHYRYFYGINVQAFIAYIAGIALPFPGFVGSLGPSVSAAAVHIGDMGWLISYFTSMIVYIVLCLIWPNGNQRLNKAASPLRFEQMAFEQQELMDTGVGLIEGETWGSEDGGSQMKAEEVREEPKGTYYSAYSP